MNRTLTTRMSTVRATAALLGASLALATLAAIPSAGAQQAAAAAPPPPPKVVAQAVTPGLTMLSGEGGNIVVSAGKDGVFIVDDQFDRSAPAIVAAIAALQPGPVRFLINTHWHGDHTGGNPFFGSSGAVIVAQDNVRKRMSVPQFVAAFNMKTEAAPPQALPVVTFADSVTLHLNGDDVRVIHVENAHTDGDAIVVFTNANVIHMGDTFFNGMYPFIDIGTGGSIRGMIRAADTVLALANDATKIVPGHGALGTKDDLKAFRDMLQTVADRVAKLVRERKSAEQVVAAKPTADFEATFGKGFLPAERWLPIVYADLVREAAPRKPAR